MNEGTPGNAGQTDSKSKKDLNILIAEDEGDICFLLNLMLKKDDTEIDHVNTLAQAKVFLKEEKPDLIIIDNKLPDGQGVDFIPEIKASHPEMKIIMISGNSSNSDKDKAIGNGADMFIAKPFTKDQMRQALEQLVGYQQA